MADLETLVVSFGADLSNLTKGIGGAKILLAGFGLGAIAAGAASVKMAASFQSSMTSLVTGAGESQKNIGMVSQGILDMAVQTGTSTKQLADGMYMIESAGYHGQAGLDVLKAAAEGAKVGNADLGVVADGVTTIMTDYASKNITAAQATNVLVATVANGKTHMQDLASAMATVLPTASAVGVGLVDVSGAMATMTGEGVPAADAATYLRQMLMALESPASAGAKTLKEIGLSASDVSNGMKVSLPGTLQMIEDHLAKKFPVGSAAYIDALKNISGGSKQMQGMLDLTGDHLSTFKSNVDTISGAVKKGGDSITGWGDVQKDFNFKMDQGKEALETLGIKIGTALLPALGNILTNVTPIITNFTNWLTKSNALQNGITLVGNVLGTLGKAISTVVNVGTGLVNFFKNSQVATDALVAILITAAGITLAFAIASIPPLVTGFGLWAAGAAAAAIETLAATWPIILVGVAIAALITGIILLVQHWQQVSDFAVMIWGHITKFFQDDVAKPIGDLFNNLGITIQNVWSNVVKFWQDDVQKPFQNAITAVGNAFNGLGTIVHNIGNAIGKAIKGGINDVIGVINGFIGFIDGIQIHIPAIGVGPVHTPAMDWNGLGIPKIPLLAQGGVVPPGGMAIAGETGKPELVFGGTSGANVLGVNQTAAMMRNQQPVQVHNHIYIDGREITNSMMVNALSQIRSAGHPIGAIA